MSANTEARPLLDPIAFASALVLAPLLFAALNFWMFLIPVIAVPLGCIPYLVFGGPVFMWMVTRYPVRFGTFAIGGLMAHAIFIVCLGLWESTQSPGPRPSFGFFALAGAPFAAFWSGTFACLYTSFYRHPLR